MQNTQPAKIQFFEGEILSQQDLFLSFVVTQVCTQDLEGCTGKVPNVDRFQQIELAVN